MPRSLTTPRASAFGNWKKNVNSGQTRLQVYAQNNLGVIPADQVGGGVNGLAKKVRDDFLDELDAYYDNCQYDDLMDWESAAKSDEYVPVRQRKPRIIYNLGKVLVDKVASKLIGSQAFPKFVVEDDPDDTEFFRVVQKASNMRRELIQPVKHLLKSGAVFVRFKLVEGQPIIEHYNAKYCYPQFDPLGELSLLEVRYVYADKNDLDGRGKPKNKWFRLVLTSMSDILYDNPEYRPGAGLPDFTVVSQADHNLGWVQGEWFRTAKEKNTVDGPSLYGDILGFIDELNYSLSQTSQAVGYNQEPQLGLNNMDEDEINELVRSSQKAWNLGREGKAEFIESDLNGLTVAEQSRDHMRHRALDVVRVILHDPEKMVANAQSGKALEILHGPLVELIDEIRSFIEPSLRNLLIKISMTMLIMGERGENTILEVPPGFQPKSFDITTQWPAIFPITIEDLQKKVSAAGAAAMGSLISRESLTRWLAPDFGIENVDEELQKIGAQPILNPFGSGFGGGFGG